jgi:NitT/TauT family transport system substrate-binding protein
MIGSRIASAIAALLMVVCAGTTNAQEKIRLTMVMGGENLVTLPVLYARAGGLFEKAGLDIRWLPVNQQWVNILDSGAADFIQGTPGPVLSAQGVGKDLVIFATLARGFFNQLVLTNRAVAKLPPGLANASTRDRLQAIKGMTIGTALSGTSTDLAFRAMLMQAGLNPDKDLTIVPNGDVANLVPAARANRLDGFFTSPPNTSLAIEQGWGKQWVDMSTEIDLFREAPSTIMAAKRSTLTNNLEAAVRITGALRVAMDDIRNRPQVVRDAVKPKFFEHVDAKTFDIAFDAARKLFDHDMLVTRVGYEQAAGSLNIVDQTGKPTKVPYDRLFDFSPVKEAMKRR